MKLILLVPAAIVLILWGLTFRYSIGDSGAYSQTGLRVESYSGYVLVEYNFSSKRYLSPPLHAPGVTRYTSRFTLDNGQKIPILKPSTVESLKGKFDLWFDRGFEHGVLIVPYWIILGISTIPVIWWKRRSFFGFTSTQD